MPSDDSLDAHFEIEQRRRSGSKRGGQQFYVDLQPSEMTLANMASRIYAARLASGVVIDGQEEAAMRKAVTEAIRIAQYVEHWVEDAAEAKR